MTLTPTGPGLTLALVSTILLALSWITVVARVIVRYGIKALGSDDYLMVTGLVCLPSSETGSSSDTYSAPDILHFSMSSNHFSLIQRRRCACGEVNSFL